MEHQDSIYPYYNECWYKKIGRTTGANMEKSKLQSNAVTCQVLIVGILTGRALF